MRHFMAALFLVVFPASAQDTSHCLGDVVNGYCTMASEQRTAPYENTILEWLPQSPVDLSLTPTPDFPDYLREALGYDNAIVQAVEPGHVIPYRGGTLQHNRVRFAAPSTKIRFLHARHATPPDTAVVILHGHSSTADKVMGTDIYEDYLRSAGAHLFDAGFDVIAFDVVFDGTEASRIHGQLLNHGTGLYGLWAKAVCSAAEDLRTKHQRVVLYGLSNGGILADHISVVCDRFDLVIVDDILDDWRADLAANPNRCCTKNYIAHYLRPFLFDTNWADFVLNGHGRKVYTRTPEGFEPLLGRNDLPFTLASGVNPASPVSFAYKRYPHHVAEYELVLDLIAGVAGLPGQHVPPPCGDSSAP